MENGINLRTETVLIPYISMKLLRFSNSSGINPISWFLLRLLHSHQESARRRILSMDPLILLWEISLSKIDQLSGEVLCYRSRRHNMEKNLIPICMKSQARLELKLASVIGKLHCIIPLNIYSK